MCSCSLGAVEVTAGGVQPRQGVEPGAVCVCLFIPRVRLFGLFFFNGGLAKVKRKKQFPLAVKKQPPNSHIEAESWTEALERRFKALPSRSSGQRERRDALCSQ